MRLPSFRTRRLVTAALTANAVRPLPGERTVIPTFFAGWLGSELAPHIFAVSAVDLGQALVRRRASPLDVVVAAASLGGLAWMVLGANRSGALIESTLRDGVGPDYQKLLDSAPTAAELGTPWLEIARPFRMTRPDVEVERNIGYKRGGKRAQLDIYSPKRTQDDPPLRDAPVLVQVHGGGWTIGTKEQQGLLLMNRMASLGWVCVAVNYRLAPKHPFPAQIVDVKKSLAWVHEHIASYGGDPSYVVVTGGSAGGHLAALAALTPQDKEYQPGFEDADTSVVACVPFYGVYDLAGAMGDRHSLGLRDSFLGPRVFKKDPKTHLGDFEKASPLLRVNSAAPDFFVLHGQRDSLVNIAQAREFVRRLKDQSGATVTYAELPGAQHAFDVFSSVRSQHAIKAVERWLRWHRATWLAATSPSVPEERAQPASRRA